MGETFIIIRPDELKKLIREEVRQERERISLIEKEKQAESEWLTRKEVKDIFNVSLGTVDNLSRDGVLKKHYLGGSPRFKREEVLEALAAYNKYQSPKTGV